MVGEKTIIEILTRDSISIKKQKYIVVDDQEYAVGEPWRRAYINSIRGREEVQNELPQAQVNAIMAVWGDVPTVDEKSDT
jgi:hypothetical protein